MILTETVASLQDVGIRRCRRQSPSFSRGHWRDDILDFHRQFVVLVLDGDLDQFLAACTVEVRVCPHAGDTEILAGGFHRFIVPNLKIHGHFDALSMSKAFDVQRRAGLHVLKQLHILPDFSYMRFLHSQIPRNSNEFALYRHRETLQAS